MTSYRLAACGYVKAVIREQPANPSRIVFIDEQAAPIANVDFQPTPFGTEASVRTEATALLFTASSTSLKPLTEQNGLPPKVDDE